MKNVEDIFSLYSERKPQFSVDIETNPVPQVNFKASTNVSRTNSTYSMFFHINAQSLIKERLTLEDKGKYVSTNTICGLSKTWLKETDTLQQWQNNPNSFKTFRSDRDTPIKDCGENVMLIIPSSLNPGVRNFFESLRVECSLNSNSSSKQKQLIIVSYNRNKRLYHHS